MKNRIAPFAALKNPSRGLRALFSLTLTIGLCACGTGKPLVKTFAPSRLGVSDVIDFHDRTTGGLGGDAGIDRQKDEVVAGFERFYQRDPVRNIQHFYRGGVAFDLTPVSSIKSKVVEKATLTYKVRQSYVRNTEGTSPGFVNLVSCASEMFNASGDWTKMIGSGGYATAAFPVDTSIAKLPRDTPPGNLFTIDVTQPVRAWVVKPEENFGIILRGPDEAVTGARNDACATRYGDFSLRVDLRVFE